jgi:ribonucleoside-triphosphate reductase
MPYFTLTPTFSVCPDHGYIRGEIEACPDCSAATEIYSRVVGYLRPVKQWNKGKQAEFELRQTYHVNGTASEEKEEKDVRLYPVEVAQQSGVAR